MADQAEVVRMGRPLIGDEECAAVTAVLRSGRLAQGAEVAGFEAEFSETVAGRPCVAVNSGTSALHLGLVAAGIGPGDEVVVPSFSFAATANAVMLAGGSPIFADIDPETFCLDPSAVAAAVGPRTAAIVPVHLYGHPADMTGLVEVAARYGLAIVEDCAQAHLASFDGAPVGTFGTAGAFSFYPTKNMTSGEGGIVVCADEQMARTVRLLRNQGMERRYQNEVVGYNLRMSDIHAAIGRVQLARLPEWTNAREANAKALTAAIDAVVDAGAIRLPAPGPAARHVWHQYTVQLPERDSVAAALGRRGIETGVYYPVPIHRLPAYDRAMELPVTDHVCEHVLSLPVGPALGSGDIDRVALAVGEEIRR